MNPFENWTGKHWANLGIFVLGLALAALQKVTDWNAISAGFTPANVAGFLIAVIAYARSINAERPRESFTERRGEPDAKLPGGERRADAPVNPEGGQ